MATVKYTELLQLNEYNCFNVVKSIVKQLEKEDTLATADEFIREIVYYCNNKYDVIRTIYKYAKVE